MHANNQSHRHAQLEAARTLWESRAAACASVDASLTSALTPLPLDSDAMGTVLVGDFAFAAPAINYWRRIA